MLQIKCSFTVYQSHSLFTRANQTNQDGYLSNCICEHKHSFKVSESTEFKRMVFSLLTRDMGVSQLEATTQSARLYRRLPWAASQSTLSLSSDYREPKESSQLTQLRVLIYRG